MPTSPKTIIVLLISPMLLAPGCTPTSPTDMVAPRSDSPADEKPAPTQVSI